MILEFSVSNTYSIKDTQTISFEPVISDSSNSLHVIKYGDKEFLKMACLYGANASGKTNMARVLFFYFDFIINSFISIKPNESTGFIPFLFDDESRKNPGSFNLVFYAEDFDNSAKIIKYEYNLVLTGQDVQQESLYCSPKGQKKLIFERNLLQIKWGNFVTGPKNIIEELVRPNCSLIGVGAQANHPIFKHIYNHFSKRIKDGLLSGEASLSNNLLMGIEKDPLLKSKIIGLLGASDFGSITDILIETQDIPDFIINLIPEMREQFQKTGHRPQQKSANFVHHYNGKDYKLPVIMESAGTKRMMELTLPLIQLCNSSVLIMDEIESSLHQTLLETFIRLFLETSNDSQILFTTHNQDLLESSVLRDDEVWFCYKDDKGASLYNSITDFTGIRKEASRKKLYMAGKFGALPIIDMQKLRELFSGEKD